LWQQTGADNDCNLLMSFDLTNDLKSGSALALLVASFMADVVDEKCRRGDERTRQRALLSYQSHLRRVYSVSLPQLKTSPPHYEVTLH
jgi:hypothetical protein